MSDTYHLKITVLSPLHIGSGERLTPKSLWVRGGKTSVVDEQALFQKIAASPALLNQFEKFTLNPHQSLLQFFKSAHLAPADVALYTIEHLGKLPNKYYFSHIKVPGFPPRPYLPGSSLKGALRSAFLRSRLIDNPQERQRAANLVRQQMGEYRPKRKRADNALEQAVFGPDQHREWMRLFQLSDTLPISPAHLWATEVRILSIRGQGAGMRLDWKGWKPGKPTTLHPEVIRPGTILNGRLTILDELLSSDATPTLRFPTKMGSVRNLLWECNRVAQEQIVQEQEFGDKTKWQKGNKFYGWMGEQLARAAKSNACLLRLGWGAGYDDKTITDLLDDDTFEDVLDQYRLTVGRPGRKLNNPPLEKSLSPKSRKVALDKKNRWVPMGWIKIEIQPAEQGVS